MADEVALSPEELKQVEEARKSEASLPTYFNAALNREVKISRDFETFLILSPDDVKQEAISWLSNASKLTYENTDRDALLTLAINNDAADAGAQVDAVNAELDEFNKFREKFTTARFASVTEVGMIIADMQRQVGELTLIQDRASHLVVLANIMKARLDRNKDDEKTQKQLDSWNNPLSSY